MPIKTLAGKVCIVTGATRGIGKGIALQLAEKGAKVYVTGRTLDPASDSKIGGSLRETAQEIEARGGICVPVQCDHSNDNDIEQLFEQVKRENEGQLDILVNNAFSAVKTMADQLSLKFWEQSPLIWDDFNVVGLRNNYICAVHAARIMVPRKRGLIVNISSLAGLRYSHNVSFGVGKEACDRMAADCGFELQKHNVAFISLWVGMVGTENVMAMLRDNVKEPKADIDIGLPESMRSPEKMLEYFEKAETPEFAGQCIAAIANDTDLMKMSGKIVSTCDLARRYNLRDSEGHGPTDFRQINTLLQLFGHPWLAWCIPDFVRIPKWVVALGGNNFF
ncbi:dehydrogenase/reductase SDR family member 1-like [Mercenaria mercenaria]|uniref:dehydrogenase/reductase SDR family member 1-like n=1 Tax=Mercenaria mercenaria TaxID=6596 RepID=UPI00234F1CD8|nr:dehydrogenase/reductase SDR family member 1-like [Mercenaria mercenaria]XP_045188840.2 dehydrogenase/reductase SDR family member 1-like [Mercenaria mercenaria]